jgi:hypothetical protein
MGSIAPDFQLMQQNDRYGKDGDHQSDNIIFIHKTLFLCVGIIRFAFCMENYDPRSLNYLQNSCTVGGI